MPQFFDLAEKELRTSRAAAHARRLGHVREKVDLDMSRK